MFWIVIYWLKYLYFFLCYYQQIEQSKCFQIGYDIHTTAMIMSEIHSLTLFGCLTPVKWIKIFLYKLRHYKIWFLTEKMNYSMITHIEYDWHQTLYENEKESLPTDALGKHILDTLLRCQPYACFFLGEQSLDAFIWSIEPQFAVQVSKLTVSRTITSPTPKRNVLYKNINQLLVVWIG